MEGMVNDLQLAKVREKQFEGGWLVGGWVGGWVGRLAWWSAPHGGLGPGCEQPAGGRSPRTRSVGWTLGLCATALQQLLGGLTPRAPLLSECAAAEWRERKGFE